MPYPCTDDPNEILEYVGAAKSNAQKFNTFVNGNAQQTVQLGTGDPTPTLRKFIADAQSVVATAANEAAETVLDDVADMKLNKADKVAGAEEGNIAGLTYGGNLFDTDRAVYDFVPLLAYAHDEALDLALLNRMNVEVYDEWYARGIAHLEAANIDAMKAVQSIRDMMKAFDESFAQHRLQARLFAGTNPGASSKPVLFVISGQSNAVGSGAFKPFDRAVDCGWFWLWRTGANELKPIVDPVGAAGGLGSGWCAFARRFFALTGRKVILLNIASGGSVVTDGGYTTTNTWADNGYGTLRSSRQTIWNAFSAAVPASSYDLGGILWDQGGTDGDRIYAGTITVQDFKDGTLDVWEWHRTLAGSATCPIFAALIDYNYSCLTNTGIKAARKAIMDATYDLCINGDDENVHLGFTIAPDYINAWDYYMSDTVHYNPHGYRVQGDSFARSAAHFLEM